MPTSGRSRKILLPYLMSPEPDQPSEADQWRVLGEELFALGQDSEAREAMESAHQAYAESGDPDKAILVVRELPPPRAAPGRSEAASGRIRAPDQRAYRPGSGVS